MIASDQQRPTVGVVDLFPVVIYWRDINLEFFLPSSVQPSNPSVTDQEMVVTAYVNDRFAESDWSYYDLGGARYWTFGDAPYERWVDTDRDGFWDYGRRNEGNGHWSTFDGFEWRDANGEVVGTGGSTAFASSQPSFDDLSSLASQDLNSGWFI